MTEYVSHTKIKMGSERSFGLVFGVFLLLVGGWQLYKAEPFSIYFLSGSALFFFASIFKPELFIIPNKLWFKFGILLGNIISPLVMLIIFIICIIPISFTLKVFGKDLLREKFDHKERTYWILRKAKVESMKKQF